MVLLIHIGAGNHGSLRKQQYRKLIQQALLLGLAMAALEILERLEFTNTGYGSSLNLNGAVECDASFIMSLVPLSNHQTPAVGTPSDVFLDSVSVDPLDRNSSRLPLLVLLASPDGLLVNERKLYPTKRLRLDSMASARVPVVEDSLRVAGLRSPPQRGTVVGIHDSATPITTAVKVFEGISQLYDDRNFRRYGITVPLLINYRCIEPDDPYFADLPRLDPKSLILPPAQQFYDLVCSRLAVGGSPPKADAQVLDTIGLAEITPLETTVLTLSGGNFFKLPGRIGCAGEVGGAVDLFHQNDYEVACMCLGNGEDIMTMKLSHEIVRQVGKHPEDSYPEDIVHIIEDLREGFNLQAVNTKLETIVYVGVVVTIHNLTTGEVRILYCHLTESFYFGFHNHGDDKPHVVLSKLDDFDMAGKLWTYGEFKCLDLCFTKLSLASDTSLR